MKKGRLILILALIIAQTTLAQRPCKVLPTSRKLYESLLYKPASVRADFFLIGCNVNDSIKKRLLYLLNSNWTAEEIASYIENDIKEGYGSYRIEERARERSKNNDSLYQIEKENIIQGIKEEKLAYLKKVNYYGVHPSIIKLVALLGLKESIPVLKKALSETNKQYDAPTVELALAKLGDKAYLKKVLNDCKYDKTLEGDEWEADFQRKLEKLVFLGSNESLYQLNNWLDTSKKREISSNGTLGKSAGYAVAFLLNVFENSGFKNIFKGIDPIYDMTDKLILKAKKWIINNKGKYKIAQKYRYSV